MYELSAGTKKSGRCGEVAVTTVEVGLYRWGSKHKKRHQKFATREGYTPISIKVASEKNDA